MSEPAYRVPGVTIVMLGAKSIQLSIPFYRDQLGMELQQQFGGFAFFKAGNITLVLNEELARSASQVTGATEVVIGVESVRKSHAALRKQGVHFVAEPHQVNGPMWAANFRDPDGHLFSVFGPE